MRLPPDQNDPGKDSSAAASNQELERRQPDLNITSTPIRTADVRRSKGNPMITRTRAKLDDYKAIESEIGKYIEGGRAGDSSIMKPAFHPNAQMSGFAEEGAFSGPIQALYDFVDGNGPATELDVRIINITISDERAASVVLHADHWHGNNFTDHFHLLKMEDTWKIVSKAFSHN